jgi:hypothetical protein
LIKYKNKDFKVILPNLPKIDVDVLLWKRIHLIFFKKSIDVVCICGIINVERMV